jgi:uncharacterized lipoprotein YmbA
MSFDIRPFALVAALIFAFGCFGSGTEEQPRLYVLDALIPVTESEKLDLSVGVGPILLPERLDRPQILTRSSEHEVAVSDFDRWAEPLEKGFAAVLAEDLSRAIPSDRITLYPWNRSTPVELQVAVVVTRFEREPDGGVTLAARWRLIGPGGWEVRSQQNSSYREAAGDSTDELVAAMSRTIAAFAQDVAIALRSAAQSPSP